jgi:hypothetical protein
MTDIDHFGNKEKIATILAASAALVDPDDDTKLLVMSAGRPNLDGIPIQLPGAYVTSSPVMDNIRSGPIVSESHQALVHTVRYLIVFGVAGTEAGDAEEKLDDFQKQIMELLEEDTTLTGVTTAIVDEATPERVDHNVIKAAGDVVQLRQITLKCIIRTTD